MESKARRIIIFSIAMLAISAALAIGVYSKMQKKRSLAYDAATVKASNLPEVISGVKDLQIAGVKLVDEGLPTAHLDIDVVNNSDEPCYAIDFIARGKTDVSSIGMNGYYDDPDNPRVVIAPHQIRTFTVFLGAMLEGPPIVINAARFATKDEGEDHEILELMHRAETRSREAKAAREKGRPQ